MYGYLGKNRLYLHKWPSKANSYNHRYDKYTYLWAITLEQRHINIVSHYKICSSYLFK